jgi:hypothetical protein
VRLHPVASVRRRANGCTGAREATEITDSVLAFTETCSTKDEETCQFGLPLAAVRVLMRFPSERLRLCAFCRKFKEMDGLEMYLSPLTQVSTTLSQPLFPQCRPFCIADGLGYAYGHSEQWQTSASTSSVCCRSCC